ncbi:MAG: hypothetical protein QOJ11_2573 [Frankiales bacterium]|jgi:hypothetical protein|nr:hypothetical protein [Frankiales bacterium]
MVGATLAGPMLLISVAGGTAGAAAPASASVSMTCPASAKGNAEIGCTVTVHVAVAPVGAIALAVAGPKNAAVTGVSGPAGSICSPSGSQALCTLPAGRTGALVVKVKFGFQLPYGLKVGQSIVRTRMTASAPVAGDPAPADNKASSLVRVAYPRSTAPIPVTGGSHPGVVVAATASRQFCGIQEFSGTHVTKAWCVSNISSARNGGKWGQGWVSARMALQTKYQDPPSRQRSEIIDVRVQDRKSTIYGGSTWSTVPTNFAEETFWVPENTFLGKDPFLSWGRAYTGSGTRSWAADKFSFQDGGALYRVQVRFHFGSKILGVWQPAGSSGWWTIRYVAAGLTGW